MVLPEDLRKVHVVYPILMDVIKPALHLRIAWGHPWDQNDGHTLYIYLQTGSTLSLTGIYTTVICMEFTQSSKFSQAHLGHVA